MLVHQIFINDSNKVPKEMPYYSLKCKDSILNLYKNCEYHLYSGEEVENIIKDNFDSDVFNSYKILKPYSYKSDLARYCILYLYGGLYTDLTLFFLEKIPNLENLDFFAFRDRSNHSIKSWIVSNGIIYTKPKCPIIKKCIDIVVEHCKKNHYGIDVSGPSVLGESIVLNYKKTTNHFILGERLNIYQKDIDNIKEKFPVLKDEIFNDISEGFVSDLTQQIICLCKPSGPGDIKSLGFSGTNNYMNMWNNREVYDQSIKFNTPKYFYL